MSLLWREPLINASIFASSKDYDKSGLHLDSPLDPYEENKETKSTEFSSLINHSKDTLDSEVEQSLKIDLRPDHIEGYNLGTSSRGENLHYISRDVLNQQLKLLTHAKMHKIRLVNAVCFLLEFVGLILSTQIGTGPQYNVLQMFTYLTPLTIARGTVIAAWCVILILHGIFALIPLCYKRENFDIIVAEKIGYGFAISTLLFTTYILLFSFKIYKSFFICLGIIVALKIYAHIFLYMKIKYEDMGQDYVGSVEFASLHVNFSVYLSFLSYLSIFTFFCTMAELNNWQTALNSGTPVTILKIDVNVYAILSEIFLIVEGLIAVSYYKDAFFLFTTGIILTGNYYSDEARNDFPSLKYTSFSFGIIAFVCVLIQLVAHFDSVFYLKYQTKVAQIVGEQLESSETKDLDLNDWGKEEGRNPVKIVQIQPASMIEPASMISLNYRPGHDYSLKQSQVYIDEEWMDNEGYENKNKEKMHRYHSELITSGHDDIIFEHNNNNLGTIPNILKPPKLLKMNTTSYDFQSSNQTVNHNLYQRSTTYFHE